METIKTGTTAPFLQTLLAGLPQEFADSRLSEIEKAETADFPGTKEEDWKYTRTAALLKERFELRQQQTNFNSSDLFPERDSHRLVFENGFFRKDLSHFSEENFEISDSTLTVSHQVDTKINAFTLINDACFTGGISVRVKGVVEKPVDVLFYTDNAASIVRNRIHAVSNSSALLRFHFRSSGNGKSFSNIFSSVEVNQNASLTIDQLQYEEGESWHYNRMDVLQHRDSRFTVNTFSLNGLWIRNDLNIVSNGENTETHLRGLYLLNGKQHVDNHTLMDHRQPNCYSNELYKGVMDGSSTGVFNGKVYVRKDAQKINAFQSNANILLNDGAQINTKPELEIYADDVKCSHGSTTGQMDEEALFYLRARGISEQSAQKLLIRAYAGEVLDAIDDEVYRDLLEKLMDNRFHWNN